MYLIEIILALFIYTSNFEYDKKDPYELELSKVKEVAYSLELNTSYCMLIDYNIHSGFKRGGLYNLTTGVIEHSFLVAHGGGSGTIDGKPLRLDNVNGSNNSSLGMAVVKERGYSNFGINVKYTLKGIDKTNSNIEKRYIVLHSYEGIPDNNIHPKTIVESQGCPTVSNNTMRYLDSFFKKEKNIIIYTFK